MMNTDMKQKLTAIAATAGATAAFALGLPLPAFAQAINPCPQNLSQVCSYNPNNLGKMVGNVVTILLVAAAVIALFFLIWGGIRWITSGGDKAKVESARNTIISAIIGLVVAFLAFFILTLVLNLFKINVNQLSLPQF
jgi:hypothetical protein